MSKKKRKNKNRQDNTMLFILIIILVACFAVIGFLFYKYFYAGVSSSKYGNRLDGISEYKLDDSLESDIEGLYTSESSVDKVSVSVQGKIIYIMIYYKEAIKTDKAKTLASKALDKIGKENLTFYEVQYILSYSGKDENKNFPIFGTKNANSLKVVWSK
jgi:flagellar basal body-associated protein FliL